MLWAKCNYQRTANIFCLKLELLFIILLSLEYISPFLEPLVSFEFSLKCFHWIPRIQCDHSDSKTRVRDKILKLIPIHAVILQILRIRWFSLPFSKTPLFQTSIDIFPGFQSEGLSPCLHGSRPANNEFYRFPSGETAANLMAISCPQSPSPSYFFKQFWKSDSRYIVHGQAL